MLIEVRFAAFTLSTDVALIPPKLPVMVDVPIFLPVVKPLVVIEATLTAEDCHCVTPVTSCFVPSENPAVAVNCWLIPSAMVGLAGAMLSEVGVAELTVNRVLPLIDPCVAVMVVLPAERA